MQTGNIGVTTENIFPVIKKFLYSEQEIFIREVISNGIDACQKLKALASSGNYSGDTENFQITVTINQNDQTLIFSDNGIGMTGEEIDKYINQIAFSGASEFLEKYKNDATNIIGHFGLGFYSTFMVSDTVEIVTKSYQEGAVAQHWICDGSPNYTLEDTEKKTIGTDIILHISEEFKKIYLNYQEVLTLIRKYSRFSPIKIVIKNIPLDEPIIEDDENGNPTADTNQANQAKEDTVTDLEPIWMKSPTELERKDYLDFYKKMYPNMEEPLFWIHLNVDYPFNLTGILYFPAVTSNVDIARNKVYLYSNQVFVTDHVDGILPDYLALLHGVIDSPDIPLNVSRSYLQSDKNVRKVSGYISKKVADTLVKLIKEDRESYEKHWDSIKVFIHYGVISEQGLFDKVKDALLFKDVDDNYYTYDEYNELVKENQTDKDNHVVYLYTQNKKLSTTNIEACKKLGYNILYMDDNVATPYISELERKFNRKIVFTRVDSNIPSKLILKGGPEEFNGLNVNMLLKLFNSQKPKDMPEDMAFMEECSAMGEDELPAILTINEYSRRTKEIYASNPNIGKLTHLKNYFTININTDSPIIKKLLADAEEAIGKDFAEMTVTCDAMEDKKNAAESKLSNIPYAERTEADNAEAEAARKAAQDAKDARYNLIKEYADKNDIIHEIYDIALVQLGLLYGDRLMNFLKRSVKFIESHQEVTAAKAAKTTKKAKKDKKED